MLDRNNAKQLLGAVVVLEAMDWNIYSEQVTPDEFDPAYCAVYGKVVSVGEHALSVAQQCFHDGTVRLVTCIPYSCISFDRVLIPPTGRGDDEG